MIYLLLSILASTIIFVVFKLFGRFQINVMQAIVVNYLTACACGFLFYSGNATIADVPQFDWFYYTLGLGILFIIVFNLMAMTTQRNGISVVSVATKMSLIVPIIFGLWYYKEALGIFKLIGIVLALLAVYLASVKEKTGAPVIKNGLLLPLLVFVGSGIIDTSIKYLEEAFVSENDVPLFSATIFAAAASVGIVVVAVRGFIGRFQFQLKNVFGGIALGVPNYFSIYFLVKALRSGILDSSGIFTVNNVLIVILSTLLGVLIFNEKLLARNWLGIDLAIWSLLFFAIAKL